MLTLRASAIAMRMTPWLPNLLLDVAAPRVLMTALTLRASAIAIAPVSPILLPPSQRTFKTALTSKAEANALEPSSPMLLLPRAKSSYDGVDLERVGDRDGALVADLVAKEPEILQDGAGRKRFCNCDRTGAAYFTIEPNVFGER